MANGTLTDRGRQVILELLAFSTPLPTNELRWGIAASETLDAANFTEATGAGYSRVQTTSATFSEATTGTSNLITSLNFAVSSGYTATVYGVGLFENLAATEPLLYWPAPGTPNRKTITNGSYYQIPAGELTFQWGNTTTLSLWLKNAIINYLLRGVSFSLSGTDFSLGYCTTAPNENAFGIEPDAITGYTRINISRNGSEFTRINNVVSLVNQQPFPPATSNQGVITHIGYFDSSQYLIYALIPSTTINTSDFIELNNGSTSISLT